ncbi:MAG: cytochrome c [Planctomycetota bacterium]|nr:cytochrome c [Planctomycetota bacterium]
MERDPLLPIRVLFGSAALSMLTACGFEPEVPARTYGLAQETRAAFASDSEALLKLEAGLLDVFGPPAAPRYARVAAWEDAGIDPNRPDLATGGGGSGEISDAERALLRADNRIHFESQLAAVARGDFDDVDVPARRPGLRVAWRALLDERAAGRLDADALRARGRELFEGWYPSLADSSALYRVECLHCHGVEGGGDGPSAQFLEPRPRDFRHGVFKYTALAQPARPRREDLLRTLADGLNGTSMPSFSRLSLAERHGLADLVRLLSIRGEVERRLAATFADEGELEDGAVATETADVFEKWTTAREKVVVAATEAPVSTPELVALGSALFHDATKGNCSSCHGESGAGDGAAAWKLGLSGRKEPAYLDAWGRPILPRDLRLGIYRGGSRPIDLYRRIWSGIPGTPMPALGSAKKPDGTQAVSDTEVWALVHYVRSLAVATPER